jgi:integrase
MMAVPLAPILQTQARRHHSSQRAADVLYVQFDTFQLPEKTLKTQVTYTNKKGKRETVPLVQKYCLICVDALYTYLYTH